MSGAEVKKIVQTYAEKLKEHHFRFQEVYLFGSHARGGAHEDSDIDVAVVVGRAPRGLHFLEKEKELWYSSIGVDSRIEPILLEKSDLKKDSGSIMGSEVRKHGIRVI